MSRFSIRAAYWQHRDGLSSIIIQPPSIDFEVGAKEMRKVLAVKRFCVNKSAKFLEEILTFIPGRALCSTTIATVYSSMWPPCGGVTWGWVTCVAMCASGHVKLWAHASMWPRQSWTATHTDGHPHTGSMATHSRPCPIVHGRPRTAHVDAQQRRCLGRPRYAVVGHDNIGCPYEMSSWRSTRSYGRPRNLWTTTYTSVRPRSLVGIQTIYADIHTRSLVGAHGYRWRATRLMWAPTRIDALPQPVLGDHYRGEPHKDLDAHVKCCG